MHVKAHETDDLIVVDVAEFIMHLLWPKDDGAQFSISIFFCTDVCRH